MKENQKSRERGWKEGREKRGGGQREGKKYVQEGAGDCKTVEDRIVGWKTEIQYEKNQNVERGRNSVRGHRKRTRTREQGRVLLNEKEN